MPLGTPRAQERTSAAKRRIERIGAPFDSISLANLDADDYEAIGRDLRETMQRALQEWQKA
jgi:hypothetical protein